jgi:polyphenol oxidase
MLERRAFEDGVVAYLSPHLAGLGVPHAFSTRIGGVSTGLGGMFSSLNLGNPADVPQRDPAENIQLNERLLAGAALRAVGLEDGRGPRAFCRIHQVHGVAVEVLHPGLPADSSVKADALISNDPTRSASMRTADCVPILISTADGRVVAAVHAGWRGLAAGVIASAMEAMRNLDRSEEPSGIAAAVGPCIGFDAYEVGPEVASAFATLNGLADGRLLCPVAHGKHHLDLAGVATAQLVQAGVSPERIDRTDRCTFRDADEFFSHRRTRGLTGRMASIIGPRPA